jgi:hypothetical protein
MMPMVASRSSRTTQFVAAGLAGFVLASGPGRPARAADDDKAACAASFEDAQTLRLKADLIGAQAASRVCAREVCASFIRSNCIQWLSEIDASIPSVVLSAQLDGRDTHDVVVQMDGRPFADSLDGRSVEVNPGRHSFVFTYRAVPGQPTQEVAALVVQGQKNRPIQSSVQSPPPPPDEIHRPVPASVYLLVAVGVLAMGSFATFAELGESKWSDLHDSSSKTGCAPFCSDSAVRQVRTYLAIGDVSLAVGVVSLGTAGVLFLARPQYVVHPGPTASERQASVPTLDVDLGAKGAMIRVGARF